MNRQTRKYINSLAIKKYRDREGCFVVEGEKSLSEFIRSGFKIKAIYQTENAGISFRDVGAVEISDSEMQQISNLKTASPVLAVLEIPAGKNPEHQHNELIIALDDIQDPGNLGTIIRLADWFGVGQILCSPFTADAYSPKTVQATMGSLARVSVTYSHLPDLLGSLNEQIPVYGAFLNGEPVYGADLTHNGIILLGNEGKGISPGTGKFVTRRLYIPPFNSNKLAESLNVALAAAIICSEFRRRTI
ncbi:MAG: RNA methyltransferase [Prevotellaceae bacterium]|jgi:TrmH family RNA methyltransferase|nr:RNA methyltransferase [Prevotellaceae bacterium]